MVRNWFSGVFGYRRQDAPYGWLSYRRNLLVLYDGLGISDDRIDTLIRRTEYAGPEGRPGLDEQWSDVNEIELRLFRHLGDRQLTAEAGRKLETAKEMGLAGAARYKEQFQKAADLEERRAVAITLMEDMFVRYSYRFAERRKRAEVSRRLTLLGLAIIGIPVLLVFLQPMIDFLRQLLSAGLTEEGFFPRDEFDELRWTSMEFSAFFVVMYFGALGAFFSRLFVYVRDMQELNWNEMDVLYSRGALWVRFLVGAIAAVIMFFLMMGDILSGPIFLEGEFDLWRPDGDKTWPDGVKPKPLIPLRPTEDFARLIIWCTLAGFSERFVPDRLGEIEAGAQGSGKRDES